MRKISSVKENPKVLLIFPPVTHEEIYSKGISEIGHVLPPLGLAYIASMLEKNDIDVKIIDSIVLKLTLEDVVKQAVEYLPDHIGISAMTPTIHRSITLAKELKKYLPDIPIIFGGPDPSQHPKEVEKYECVDTVVVGEGEYAMVDIVKNNLRGIVHGSPIKDLDELPFPARHLLPMELYFSGVSLSKRSPQATMITSRGCPHDCAFCSKSTFGRLYRVRSPKNVIAEIKYLMKEYGVKEISFWDDIWGLSDSWAEEFCDLILEEGIDLTWSCEARVDTVNLEKLKLMKKAGCWNIFYGIESGNQDLLDIIGKGVTLEQIRNAIKWTKKAGIEIRANFMLALPGETPEKAQKTIDFAKELDPDFVKFNITTPYPGTRLHDQALEYGTLEQSLNKFTNYFPVFVPKGYSSKEEILEMRKRAYREFFFRPSYILKRFLKIRSLGELSRHIRGFKALIREGT